MVRVQVYVELSDRQWAAIESDRGTMPRDQYLSGLLRGEVDRLARSRQAETPLEEALQ